MNSRCTKEAKSAEFIGQRKGDCRDDFQVSGLATWVGVWSCLLREVKKKGIIKAFLPQDS